MRQQPESLAPALTPIHPWLLRGFRLIARRRLQGSFSALRIAHLDRCPQIAGPLIIYLNHPSWWDPLTGMALAPHLFGSRSFYAPIEAEALKRYGILRRLGLFPVEIDTPRGAAHFLRTAEAVLAAGHVLGVTPQGRFTDARARPPELRSGLGGLLNRLQRSGFAAATPITIVPLALEYSFWNDRAPEALVCVGEAITVSGVAETQLSAAGWTDLLGKRLAATQDELAVLAMTRDPGRFTTLLRGRSEIGGFYGLWQRITG